LGLHVSVGLRERLGTGVHQRNQEREGMNGIPDRGALGKAQRHELSRLSFRTIK
jgi:hypothetical protein